MSADPPADAPLSVEQARRVVVFGYDAEFAENVTAFEAAVRAEEQAIAAAAVTEAEAESARLVAALRSIRDFRSIRLISATTVASMMREKARRALAAGSGSTP